VRRISLPGIIFMSALAILRVGSAQAQSSEHGFVVRAEESLDQGHPGPAILNLERARLLAPESRRIAADLMRARLVAHLPATEPRAAGTPGQLRQADKWRDVAVAGVGLTTGALLAILGKIGRRGFLAVALVGGLAATLGFWRSIQAEPPANLGVVVSPGLVARVAPSREAGVSFIPQEGSLVSVLRTEGPFVLISSGGHHGWIPTTGVERILRKS
jgi:hypothetical protein